MAAVKVRFFATFREVCGPGEEVEGVDDVPGLLDALRARHGVRFERLVRDDREASFVVLVNGRNVGHLGGSAAMLADGDEVSFFPPVSGG